MTTFAFLSPTQLLIILVIVVLIFGAKRLPDIGRGIGKSIREFKEETNNLHDDQAAKAEETKKDA